jgi:acetyl-CoA acetyltransferase
LFPSQWTQSLGRCAEEVAERFKISRQSQDEWAFRSHQLADAAWANNLHENFVTTFNQVDRDESIRADTSLQNFLNYHQFFQNMEQEQLEIHHH